MLLVTLIWLLLSVGINTIDVRRNIQWTVRNQNGSIEIPSRVPGGIYTDLRNAGIIGDIMYRFNDILTRWVAHDTWTYTGKFTVTDNQLKHKVVKLVLDGIDTVGFIELNNSPVGLTDNMFVRYAFDVRPFLKTGDNVLKVTISSPIVAARTRSSTHFTAPDCVPDVYHGECHANQLRKMQASFSWDWGPAFPSVGIWKPVSLQFYDAAIITSLAAHTNYEGDHWTVRIVIYLETGPAIKHWEGIAKAELRVDGNQLISVAKHVNTSFKEDGTSHLQLDLNVSENVVSLWWPNGYGAQPLYELRVIIRQDNSNEQYYKSIKIGFRTIELVERSASEMFASGTEASSGLTFYFEINGYPIFMKGSNWIPSHVLPELSGNNATVDSLLQAAKDTHMSMLRVWGGGIYESDYFYKRCDEIGILIWQDFMFACSMYPADKDFLDSVRAEIEHNVKRLQYHPSIALWAGNNENEVALRGNWYDTQPQFDKYRREYIKLYVDTIAPVVRDLDPTRRYLVSSPSNGIESEKEGFIANNPYDPHYGDTHYYNYLDDHWNQNIYPKTRFASEYGFQSLPSLATMRTATSHAEDYSITSEYSRHRQHSPNGYESIGSQIETQLQLHKLDPKYFDKFVFYSQISQAMALKAETEFYRQSQEDWYTMGALYWQLSDVWQAPSWSGIEYGGKWKMLHYFAKTFFAPVLVSPRLLSTGEVEVYLINDRFVPIISGEILVEYYSFGSLIPVKTESHPAYAAPLNAKKLTVISLWRENMPDFIRFTLHAPGVADPPSNFLFPKPLKQIKVSQKPNINVTVSQTIPALKPDDPTLYVVKIDVDRPVMFLWLESTMHGHFEDNGFIITTSPFTVNFISKKYISPIKLKRSISHMYYGNTPTLIRPAWWFKPNSLTRFTKRRPGYFSKIPLFG